MEKTKRSRKTKKVSADDFLDFLDDQERARGPMAFKPSPHLRTKKRRLTPIQQEWFNLALKVSPRPVSDFLKSEKARRLLDQAEVQFENVSARIQQFLKKN